jgi:hypothetical protein
MHELDYTGMPVKVFRDVVGGCEHVDVEWADGVVERMLAVSGGNLYETEYKIVREYEIQAYEIALDGKGCEQRIAVTHYGSELGRCVKIFNVESGELLATCGLNNSDCGNYPGYGIAFSRTGDLFVCGRSDRDQLQKIPV